MRIIIIGAGRGSRLMPTTANTPKCFAEVGGQSILDWTLDAFRSNGIDNICFVGGYQIDKVKQSYPSFTFRLNDDWPNNNILASLFYAEDLMNQPFICCYSDILFSSGIVRSLLESKEDISLAIDTNWKERYEHRTQHPSDDAEKVTVSEDGVITGIHRDIPSDDAYGEYIGVAKFSLQGAQLLRDYYHRCRNQHAGRPFHTADRFEKAYKIHLLQEMVESGERLTHVDTCGEYIEIDTQEDFEYARNHWTSKHLVG